MNPLWSPEALKIYDKYKNYKGYIVSGTGHRPQRLGLSYGPKGNRTLYEFVREYLVKLSVKPDFIISGMAQGFDQALAHAAISLNIPIIAAIPFSTHSSKWPKDAQLRYRAILNKAKYTVVICRGGASSEKFIARDHFMVELANEILALYDGKNKGGTALTVKYANNNNKAVTNLWDQWRCISKR